MENGEMKCIEGGQSVIDLRHALVKMGKFATIARNHEMSFPALIASLAEIITLGDLQTMQRTLDTIKLKQQNYLED